MKDLLVNLLITITAFIAFLILVIVAAAVISIRLEGDIYSVSEELLTSDMTVVALKKTLDILSAIVLIIFSLIIVYICFSYDAIDYIATHNSTHFIESSK